MGKGIWKILKIKIKTKSEELRGKGNFGPPIPRTSKGATILIPALITYVSGVGSQDRLTLPDFGPFLAMAFIS